MRVSGIFQSLKIQLLSKRRIKDVTPKEKISASDKVQISSEAKALQNKEVLFQIAKEALKTVPNVRLEKVQQARTRIEQNFYSGQNIVSKLTDSIMKSGEFSISSNLSSIARRYLKQVSPVRENKISDVNLKIKQGFYSQASVTNELAEKLLQEFGI